MQRSLEDLSVPEMHAIEERVRTIVSAELAKQPVVKPGLERDHVQELINTALARESVGREEPLGEEEVERLVSKQLSSVEAELAALRHAANTKAAAPPPPVISVTEEASADIVEGERMRIMAWVQEAIDKARLAPAASAPAATPTPGAPTPLPYVRPEDINLEEIKSAVMEDVYKLLFADAVGKPDYALASVGGSVVDYSGKWSLGRLAGMLSPFPGRATSVDAVIEKDTTLGACWPMAGSSGFVTVKLAQRVLVDSISIEHVSSTIAHNLESAPRDVRFWVSHLASFFFSPPSDICRAIQQAAPRRPSWVSSRTISTAERCRPSLCRYALAHLLSSWRLCRPNHSHRLTLRSPCPW